jgi:hypothetical protein
LSRFVLLTFAMSAAFSPRVMDAQASRVTGTVVDSAGAKMAGIMVVALDGQQQLLARTLTGRSGTFELSVLSAGSFDLRAFRVGYAVSEPLPLVPGPSLSPVTLRVSATPTKLSGQSAKQKSVCGMPKDTTSDVTLLWEEARKVIAATRMTFGTENASARVSFYDRKLSANGKSVLTNESREGNVSARAPFASLSPDSIAIVGYVIETEEEVSYYAPDAEVLLSAKFSNTHCFGVQSPPSGQPGLIGLSFKPKNERLGVRDIAGTFWLDRATLELRRIEYRYIECARRRTSHPQVGGDMDFAHLSNGMWLIRHWEIRMPQGQATYSLRLNNAQVGTKQVVNIESLRASGGEVRQVTVGNEVIEVKGSTPDAPAPDAARFRSAVAFSRMAVIAATISVGAPSAHHRRSEFPDHADHGIAGRAHGVTEHRRRQCCSRARRVHRRAGRCSARYARPASVIW